MYFASIQMVLYNRSLIHSENQNRQQWMAVWKDANIEEEGFRCISHSGGITFGPDTEPNIYHPDNLINYLIFTTWFS